MVLATLLVSTFVLLPASHASRPSFGQHIEIAARCDPPSVRPGGWVDVVVEVRVDPTWHVTSPSSAAGQRATLALELPTAFALSGRLRAPPGRELHDDVFGAVEILEGRFELRQRLRVPREQPAGELALGGSSSWVVCDPVGCLPPQDLAFVAPLVLAADGAPGPNPAIGEPRMALTEEEHASLVADGLVAQARPELESVQPGEELLVALDVAFDPARWREVIDARIGASSDWRPLGSGWRVREEVLELRPGVRCRAIRMLLPLRIDKGVLRTALEIPIEAELEPEGSEAIEPVLHDTRVVLRIER